MWLRIGLVVLPTVYTIYSLIKWRIVVNRQMKLLKAFNPDMPAVAYFFPRILFSAMDVTRTGIIPDWLMPLPGTWLWTGKYNTFAQLGCDTISVVWPNLCQIWVANADLVKEIVTRKTDFVKPTALYMMLDIFGSNVVSTEHAEWRRHRKIIAPQFSERNNMCVHRQTVRTVHDMFRSWQTGIHGATANTEHELCINVSEDLAKLALYVISGAGFGMRLDWDTSNTDTILEHGHSISFKSAIQGVIKGLQSKIILPKLAYALPIPSVQRLKLVFDEFEQYSSEMIRDADTQTDDNLLVSLTKASRADTDIGGGLTERELIGNIFVFMFAGHETTAATMVYALAMLATQPAAQQRMYEEITLVLKGGDPEYKHIHELAYTLAVMNETLRMFPPVIRILKYATNQQTLGKYTIPENTNINLHVSGLHYNPAYWGPDPTVFRPERWFSSPDCAKHATKTSEFFRDSAKSRTQPGQSAFSMHSTDHEGVSPNDGANSSSTLQPHLSIFSYNRFAFIPFSEGPRSCIGKRFAQVEFITTLALIVQKYTIHLPDGVCIEDLVDSTYQITLLPKKDVKLCFRPRA
ncbi:hypothetical protein BASA60_006494 [Batrachochytrium salamandrivorans]|nr:hypothetical protein BASA60_006494 [Batrachochytrium salamandrivorans]